jgi:hypothetical protein
MCTGCCHGVSGQPRLTAPGPSRPSTPPHGHAACSMAHQQHGSPANAACVYCVCTASKHPTAVRTYVCFKCHLGATGAPAKHGQRCKYAQACSCQPLNQLDQPAQRLTCGSPAPDRIQVAPSHGCLHPWEGCLPIHVLLSTLCTCVPSRAGV